MPFYRKPSGNRRRGMAMVEVSLILPVISFLFVGAMDLGYFAFSLISIENATRVAALYTSTGSATSSDSAGACRYVLAEMNTVPHNGTISSTCSSGRLTVRAASVRGPGGIACSRVSVTYQSIALIPIPGVLANQFTWTRTLTMPLRS
jgi:Flp pilus assembly protein TadG